MLTLLGNLFKLQLGVFSWACIPILYFTYCKKFEADKYKFENRSKLLQLKSHNPNMRENIHLAIETVGKINW